MSYIHSCISYADIRGLCGSIAQTNVFCLSSIVCRFSPQHSFRRHSHCCIYCLYSQSPSEAQHSAGSLSHPKTQTSPSASGSRLLPFECLTAVPPTLIWVLRKFLLLTGNLWLFSRKVFIFQMSLTPAIIILF